jgi:hypothetical protein
MDFGTCLGLLLLIGAAVYFLSKSSGSGYCKECNNAVCVCTRCPKCKTKLKSWESKCKKCGWVSPYIGSSSQGEAGHLGPGRSGPSQDDGNPGGGGYGQGL